MNVYVVCLQNDSPLEWHHWRVGMRLVRDAHVFEHLDDVTRHTIETQTRELILVTDMAKHKQQLTSFKVLQTQPDRNA